MSATIDSGDFADYFADLIRGQVTKAPVLEVEGNLHHVQPFYWDSKDLRHIMPVFCLGSFVFIIDVLIIYCW